MQINKDTKKPPTKIESNVIEMSSKVKLNYKLDPDTIFFDNQEFLQLMNICVLFLGS